ncbi:MAG: hypothetical protein H0U53_08570 [Actinobacteria bacterium]|nr:hypothetical protein [Actinomycetota bacterium]
MTKFITEPGPIAGRQHTHPTQHGGTIRRARDRDTRHRATQAVEGLDASLHGWFHNPIWVVTSGGMPVALTDNKAEALLIAHRLPADTVLEICLSHEIDPVGILGADTTPEACSSRAPLGPTGEAQPGNVHG